MSGDLTNSAGDILLTNTANQQLTHTGSATGDLTIISTNGDVIVEGVTVAGTTVSTATGDLSVVSTLGSVIVEGVTVAGTAVSDITALSMSGDLTNSAGDILLTNTANQQLTHTGSATGDLSIVSTNGDVVVEGVTVSGTAVSAATGDLSVVSTLGSVIIEGVKLSGSQILNVDRVKLNKGFESSALNTNTGLGPAAVFNSECTTSAPCGTCLGDCDTDNECESGLSCVERTGAASFTPGCTSSGHVDDNDYCTGPPNKVSNTASGSFALMHYTTAAHTCDSSIVGSFTLTSSFITSTSVVHVMVSGYTGNDENGEIPHIRVTGISAGTATLKICNLGSTALSGVISFNYAVW